ncbi:hsp70 family protein [Pseudobacteriovorax antillogorgiicola]|uniref:Hsp70 protein n=1 Tax=Pseudobacteriovorax antillogorgiicola TaxID=1513793 RepID=A0A1Y6C7S0_9BACT|nr:hsp70 family protein [Pseudobacteriovorax antillogorgiicola]TCS51714.1 Hsp70 protein [Pseudobacteriovorax antillogorgiicola]SMF49343.1 Hsp70 protein [Pseudobacteriovorax antillogorgiicola]
MTKPRYLIGIDLGTSNCALSYIDLDKEDGQPQVLDIAQWYEGGEVKRQTLPSFLAYLSKSQIKRHEGKLKLHGETPVHLMVGLGAKDHAMERPDQVIHSAKSWLSHKGVDRSQPLLPWNSDEILGDKRLSPIQAGTQLLDHLRLCWNYEMAAIDEQLRFENQKIAITVPASFDPVAQELTLKAALNAGYPENSIHLLEEPLAAFYNWQAQGRDQALAGSKDERRVLVCDIGGGTCDFTLLKLDEKPDTPVSRIRVSSHILLGGDNIDLALAHLVEAKQDQNLSSYPWAQVLNQCRDIKEKVLGGSDQDRFHITAHLGGSSLFGQTFSEELKRADVLKTVEQFFPHCPRKQVSHSSENALQDWGLPFAQDPAVTHHLAEFLDGTDVHYILFAGGTMKPRYIQELICEQLERWQGFAPEQLEQDDLDLAVAKGASAYLGAKVSKQGLVESRYPRNLFLKVGAGKTSKALCLIPKGQETEAVIDLDLPDLRAQLNRSVVFELLSDSSARPYESGEIVSLEPHFESVARLQSRLKSKVKGNPLVAVSLRTWIRETGSLVIECHSQEQQDQWPLSFDLSDSNSAPNEQFNNHAVQVIPTEKTEALIRGLYGKGKHSPQLRPKQLAKSLEQLLDRPRQDWDLVTLRSIWSKLESGLTRRGRSLDHEVSWLNLAGFTMRPGYGHSQDGDAIESLWRAHELGLQFPKEASAQEQWWILWRRVAGGLSKERQELLWDKIFPSLKKDRASSAQQYLLAGSLERVDMNRKVQLGNALAQQIAQGSKTHMDAKIWCLSRLASRIPLYGGPEHVIRPSFIEQWAETLEPLRGHDHLYRNLNMFYSQAGRMVNDREMDISPEWRQRFLKKLEPLGADQHHYRVVSEYVPVSHQDQNQLFGEDLPLGLYLS